MPFVIRETPKDKKNKNVVYYAGRVESSFAHKFVSNINEAKTYKSYKDAEYFLDHSTNYPQMPRYERKILEVK